MKDRSDDPSHHERKDTSVYHLMAVGCETNSRNLQHKKPLFYFRHFSNKSQNESLARYRGRKEGNVLFNDALNTFYFTVIWRQT